MKNKIPYVLPLLTMILFGVVNLIDPTSVALPFYCLIVSFVVGYESASGAALIGLAIATFFGLYSSIMFRNVSGPTSGMILAQHFAIMILPFCALASGLVLHLIRSLLRRAAHSRVVAHQAGLELRSLREALDCSKDGIAVLDGDMNMQFANQIFRRLFRFLPGFIDTKPNYSEVVRRALYGGAYEIDDSQRETIHSERMAFVRSGNPLPVLLKLAGGKKIRFTCGVLPDGGRMLNYTDVTDMVEEAERLEELANLDGMTGLANRRQLNLIADRDFERAKRELTPLCVIILDIDRFKAVNDRFGHDVGDRAICHVANICRDSKRTTDLAARIGGEEFVLLLPDTALEGATILAERIRRRVEANPLLVNGKPMDLTVSIGVAQAATHCGNVHELMKSADELLYKAKNSGRNRVVVMPPNDPANCGEAAA